VREGLPVDEVVFGRYRLLSLIGAGGMGKVYKAHDTVIDRDVAIKVLPPELGTEAGYRERFRREAHIAARLTEPHIIPIHDAGEIDDRLYLVMPIIDGIDVHTLLQRDGPLSPQRAVQMIEQLAAALDAAHAVGLVHRDVKPSNALVTGRDFVYLIDFGIAHDASATKLTSTGVAVGTYAYMAPERFITGTADARADVYSLACVLYECLTGKLPLPGTSLPQQMHAHLYVDPPRLSDQRPGISTGFDEVIARGMAKDPNRRYPTAIELADAAHHALTTTGHPQSTPRLLADPTRPASGPLRLGEHRPPAPPPASVWQRHSGELPLAPTPQPPPGWTPIPPPRPADGPPAHFGTPPPARGQHPPRQVKWPLIAALAAVILAGGVAITSYHLWTHRAPPETPQPSTTTQPVTPVAVPALEGLLLNPDQINTATRASAMTAVTTYTATYDDSAHVSDKACLPLNGPAEKLVYAGTGHTAVRGQAFRDPGDNPTHVVQQVVVLFSSAQAADAFFTASAQHWPACANRQFTYTQAGKPDVVETVGPVSETNGTLSATQTQEAGNGWACQRALTVANNVAIDVVACSYTQSDFAIGIAHQIAAKVPTT
jgi:serine/threonine kinase PknH